MGYTTYSLETDGLTQYAKMGDCHGFDYDSTFTWLVWFKTTDTDGYLLSKMDNTPTGYGLYVGSSGALAVQLFAGAANQLEVTTDSTGWNDGAWHQAAVTYDGSGSASGVVVWVDGVEQVLTTVSDTLGANSLVNLSELNFAGRNNGSDLLACRFTEIVFYSAVLDEQQVGFLYDGGNTFNPKVLASQQYIVGFWRVESESVGVLDDGPGNLDGTPVNLSNSDVSSDTPGGVSTKSLSFSSVLSQSVTLGASALLYQRNNAFSISFWMKSSSTQDSWVISKITSRGYGIRTLGGASQVIQVWLYYSPTNRIDLYGSTIVNDGNWHHVLMSYNGSSSAAGVLLWVDGAAETITVVGSTVTSNWYTTPNLHFSGYSGGTTLFYTGLLDEISAYSAALAALDATEIYNLGAPADLLTLSSASSLAGWWKLDNEFEVAQCSDYGIHPKLPAKQGAGQVQRVPCSKTGTDYALLSYLSDMRFRGAGPGGVAPHCMSTNASDLVCHVGRPPSILYDNTSVYTVSVWIRCIGGANTSSGGIVGATNGGSGWYLAIGSDGKLRFGLRAPANYYVMRLVATTTTWHDSNWHHVLASKSGDSAGTMRIWVDGVEQPISLLQDSYSAWEDYDYSVVIGVNGQARSTQNYRGDIADIALYNVALGLADAVEHYNGGVPLDLTTLASASNMTNYWMLGNVPGVLLDGSLQGILASRFSTDTPGGVARRSLVLGSGDRRADMGTNIRLERDLKFSWSIWFKTGSNAGQIIIGKEGSGRIGYYTYISSVGKITFTLCNTSTNRQVVETINGGWNDRSWHHLVVAHGGVSSASSMAIYVDGVLEATNTVLDALTATIATGERLYFGARNYDLATTYFRGLLAEPVLFLSELSLAEVNEMYNGGTPVDPATTSMASYLAFHWSFGDGYNPAELVVMSVDDIQVDAPIAAVAIPTEKVWVTEDQYDLGAGSSTEVASRIIHLDWKNKLAAHGWTVIGSSNGTIYEYEGETSGGVYGGDSTGPFDVWASQTDVKYRDSDLGQGPSGWVVLRSPLSIHGQFWLIIWIYASWYADLRAYVGAGKPALRTPATELCPFFVGETPWHYLASNEGVWYDTGTSGVRNYFSVCEEDGSFVFMRQTKTTSYWNAMTIFMVMPADRVPPGVQRSVSYHWAWDTVRDNNQYPHWDCHVPGEFTTRRVAPLDPHWGTTHTSNSILQIGTVADYFGQVFALPVYLMPLASGGVYNGIGTVIGPVPDVLYSSASVVSGSTAPAVAPFAFVNVEGRYWVPGSKEPVFT